MQHTIHSGRVTPAEARRRSAHTPVALIAALALVIGVLASGAATAGAAPAHTAPVRPNQLAPGVAPQGSAVLGSLPGNQQLQLAIVLSPSHNSRLQSLLHNLYDPKSPDYHRWLRPG